jgi:hypothetical protein
MTAITCATLAHGAFLSSSARRRTSFLEDRQTATHCQIEIVMIAIQLPTIIEKM